MVKANSAGAIETPDMGRAQAVLAVAQEVWAKECAFDGDSEPLAQALGNGKGVEAAVARAGCAESGLTRSQTVP